MSRDIKRKPMPLGVGGCHIKNNKMKKHIDDFALFLYAISYSQLKLELIKEIREYLGQCDLCDECFTNELQNIIDMYKSGSMVDENHKKLNDYQI